MWKWWKSLEIISPRVPPMTWQLDPQLQVALHQQIQRFLRCWCYVYPCTHAQFASPHSRVASAPGTNAGNIRISMKKMWFVLLNLNVCTKLTLDLNLDTFDTFT